MTVVVGCVVPAAMVMQIFDQAQFQHHLIFLDLEAAPKLIVQGFLVLTNSTNEEDDLFIEWFFQVLIEVICFLSYGDIPVLVNVNSLP